MGLAIIGTLSTHPDVVKCQELKSLINAFSFGHLLVVCFSSETMIELSPRQKRSAGVVCSAAAHFAVNDHVTHIAQTEASDSTKCT